jgi:hypothetical protein
MSDRSGRSVLRGKDAAPIGNKALSGVSGWEMFLKRPLTNWVKSAGQGARTTMKVSSTSSTSATATSGGAKPAADGFGDLLNIGGATPRAAASAVSGAAGVSSISALMALQGIGGPEARARALRKGRRLLDALDRLQAALLGEGPTKRHLALLQGALAEQREASGDFGLDDTLNWAEVRVAVEAAKLERANEPA